jgi:hypothetical protein
MTTTLESNVAAPDVPPAMRRIWPRVVVGVLLVALIGVGTTAIVYANAYQPLALTSGSYGTVTPHTMKTIGDGLQDTSLIVVGPRGTKATATYPVINHGPRPVRLLGLDLAQNESIVDESLTWAPLSGTGAEPTGLPGTGRAFPVTVQPGREVMILLTATQPNCAALFKDGGSESLGTIPIRWSALGVHHVWSLSLQTTVTLPITVCPPRAALAHVTNQ